VQGFGDVFLCVIAGMEAVEESAYFGESEVDQSSMNRAWHFRFGGVD